MESVPFVRRVCSKNQNRRPACSRDAPICLRDRRCYIFRCLARMGRANGTGGTLHPCQTNHSPLPLKSLDHTKHFSYRDRKSARRTGVRVVPWATTCLPVCSLKNSSCLPPPNMRTGTCTNIGYPGYSMYRMLLRTTGTVSRLNTGRPPWHASEPTQAGSHKQPGMGASGYGGPLVVAFCGTEVP